MTRATTGNSLEGFGNLTAIGDKMTPSPSPPSTRPEKPEAGAAVGWTRRITRSLFSETERVEPTGILAILVMVLSVTTVATVFYLTLFASASQHLHISWFILFFFPICFLTTSIAKGFHRLTSLDILLAFASAALGVWFVVNEPRYQAWTRGFSEMETGDRIAAFALIGITIELCRRSVGAGLTSLIPFAIAYAAFGQLLGGSFRHHGIELDYFLDMLTISTDGIFDSPLYVAAGYAFLFVLFGNFFVMMGGGQLFFDIAAAMTGRMVGGPAKACVVSSGLYGSISGSPVADVATTGPVSIPIMKRLGIPAAHAAAIETAASCGGSMLPPVMGAVAFMMADFTGLPYAHIALYATLPALIYYLGIMFLVHFEARTLGLARLPAAEIVGLRAAVTTNWPSMIPIGALMWLLMGGYSPSYIAAGSTIAVLVTSWLKPGAGIGPRRFVEGCTETCKAMVPLAASVAAAGLIMGCIELTGLSGKFTLLLFQLSGGLVWPSLLIAGAVLILLGTGMPTTGVYLMGVALLAPMLVTKFALPVMEVHMFMLFFACLSAISPPVAPAAFAAASIAGANPFTIGNLSCRYAVGGFLLPFMFVFNNGVLLQGGPVKIATDTALCIVLVFVAALAAHGYVLQKKIPALARLAFVALCVGILWPKPEVQVFSALTGILLYAVLYAGARRTGAIAPST
jgi:TRAP transporter 4TM/12TM fusion protein